jgi:integrase
MRGQGRVFKRSSGRYFVAYYAPGTNGHPREIRERGGDTPEEARKLLRARLRALAVHKAGLRTFSGPHQERVMFGEVLDLLETRYAIEKRRSLAQLRSRLKRLRMAFGLDRALAVTTPRLLAYIQQRQGEKAATATINRELETVRRAFAVAVESNLLSVSPRVPHLRESNARQGFFERPEFEALVRALPEHLQDFTRFAYMTGWRKGEISSLRWSDVDRDGGAIRLRPEEAKTGRGRTVMIAGDLATLMERRWQARLINGNNGAPRVTDWVFHREGTPIREFRRAWQTACVAAGLYHVVKDAAGREKKVPEKLFHDLRRTAIRNMVRAGVPERVAMEVSGHRTRSVFDRYNVVSEDDLRVAAQKTAAYVEGLPSSRTEPGMKRTAE